MVLRGEKVFATDEVIGVSIYPFKSCQEATIDGQKPTALQVGPTGFEAYTVRDREFVVWDPKEQCFVSQRGRGSEGKQVKYPQDKRLASIRVDVDSERLRLSTDTYGVLDMRIAYDEDAEARELTIWGQSLQCKRTDMDLSEFFSGIVERTVEVYRTDRSHHRRVPKAYQYPDASNELAGADGMPFLLTSQASLDYQHARNGVERGTVPLNRYRANITIDGSGLGPFGEDYVRRLSVGSMAAHVVKACARCPVPNIDQTTGEQVGNGLRILRGRDGRLPESDVRDVFFGQNLNHVYTPDETRYVRVGDSVVVEAAASEPNFIGLRA